MDTGIPTGDEIETLLDKKIQKRVGLSTPFAKATAVADWFFNDNILVMNRTPRKGLYNQLQMGNSSA